jgi:hypothetical protein
VKIGASGDYSFWALQLLVLRLLGGAALSALAISQILLKGFSP